MTDMRIFLSPPIILADDIARVTRALASGWAAPTGPEVDLFEQNFSEITNSGYAVALSSGTAALHLALLALGISKNDDVLVPTLTFAATVNAIKYVGANPILLDVDSKNWCIDLKLLESYLAQAVQPPKAIISVDLFGRMPDYVALKEICSKYGVLLIVDAAESLGSNLNDRPAGSFGDCAIFSFNGNKIVTSSGGGMFVSNNLELSNKVRYLANQARSNVHWYEHESIGYNYRLSNLLAALGDSQLSRLDAKVALRRKIRDSYTENFKEVSNLRIIQDSPKQKSNAWLTNISFDSLSYPNSRDVVFNALKAEGIESRFIWKPMHMQPIYMDEKAILTGVSEKIFSESLCLPSGENLTKQQIDFVSDILMKNLERF
jgi:dTDP-4-amino-4,6-dideoxygalactose transaminase